MAITKIVFHVRIQRLQTRQPKFGILPQADHMGRFFARR